MKVGDYVRTKNYGICKITDIYTEDKIELDKKNAFGIKGVCYNTENIIKSSPNIIDLLQVGDIITTNNLCGEITNIDNNKIYTTCYDGEYCYADDIKSIVTKEQFESIKYKVN